VLSTNANTTKKRKTDSADNVNSAQSTSTSHGHVGGTPIYVFHGIVPSNPLITVLEEKLKPYIFHFLDSVCFQKQSLLLNINLSLFRLLLLNYGFN